jgi:PPOX class probable F420-dependent enzyme
MQLSEAMTWARERKHAVLITIRSDGRPQSSDVVYAVEGDAFLISLTDDRAKTRNIRRDDRVVMHITEPSTWSYLSSTALSNSQTSRRSADDATCDQLCRYYETVSGAPHPDWDEYRAAMVEQRRLIARFTPTGAVGQTN